MKTFFLIIFNALSISYAHSSNYPTNYCHEVIRPVVVSNMLLARVSSGCIEKFVLGLKSSSFLFDNDIDSVDAIVTGSCYTGYSYVTETRSIKVSKQWEGRGFVTAPLDFEMLFPKSCRKYTRRSLKIVFESNGSLDNNHGLDYSITMNSLFSAEAIYTHTSNHDLLSHRAWEIIVGLL